MTLDGIGNALKAKLVGTYANSATTFTLDSNEFSGVTTDHMLILFDRNEGDPADALKAGRMEIVRRDASADAGAVITITRAQEGTTALTIDALGEWVILLGPTKYVFDQLKSGIENLETGKENSFTKNGAFNKNFGTAAGTVAQGNDSRIVNGQTAFGWGNHASAGYITGYTVTELDVTTHQAALSIAWSQLTSVPTYDNYGSWNLKSNGVQRTTVGSGQVLDIVAGTNVSVSYGAGGVITIASTDTNTDTNFYVSNLSFDTGTGILLATLTGATNQSVDLDGRYALTSHNHAASDINSGTLVDARIAQSNVTQHEDAILDLDWTTKSANFTYAGTDGEEIENTSASNITATLNTGITKSLVFRQSGAGTITLSAGASVTLRGDTATANQYDILILVPSPTANTYTGYLRAEPS